MLEDTYDSSIDINLLNLSEDDIDDQDTTQSAK
jgi:hypothetical protein